MAWTLTDSMEEYLAGAGAYLRASPVEHTIELVVTETLRARGSAAFGSPPPMFGWWQSPGGEVAGAFLHTPPYPVLLSGDPVASAPLAAELAARGRALPGVNGAADGVAAFAAAWQRHIGTSWAVQRRSRLFRLGDLVFPEPRPPGAARIATEADSDLMTDWFAAFADETGQHEGVARRNADDRISYGGMTIWEADGIPVATAGRTRPAAGVVRVGPVYTPPEHRRQGYGGAATVAATQAALDDGADAVVLFTDLANPISNALYVRLGYRPVGDRLMLAFSPASGT
jgi:RimJ/RimL family protein N-acetyltransferase